MIKVKGLNKTYDKGTSSFKVINNTTLEFQDNGLVTILGHSGSGKTTLLNVIGGLDSAQGEIIYDDNHLDKYNMRMMDKIRNKYVGYIFQNYNLLLDKSIYENLEIALNICGIYDKIEINKRINYCLELVGMKKYQKKACKALSGGQMQRVSIARALVKMPKVIICDEPTGNLDSKNTIDVMNILKALSQKCLVLLVTHDENIASFYSDRIIKIKDGKVYSDEINNSSSSLEDNSQNIYLGDLNKEQISDEINLYYDKLGDIKIEIVYVDDQILIKTNDSHLKVIGNNCEVNIINESKKDIVMDDVLDLKYDFDSFCDTKGHKKLSIKGLGKAFFDFFSVSKKMHLLYLSFLILGMIIGYCVLSYSKNKIYSKDAYGGVNDSLYYSYDINYRPSNGNIVTFSRSFVRLELYSPNVSFDLNSPSMNLYLAREVKHKLICGEENDEDFLISKGAADYFIKTYRLYGFDSYESLLGLDSIYGKLVGITDSTSLECYINHGIFDSIGLKEFEKYEIINGRDVLSSNEVIISYDMEGYKIGDIYEEREVVGVFKGNVDYIIDDTISKSGINNPYEKYISLDKYKGKLIGSIDNPNCIGVSAFLGYEIGDYITINNKNYEVTALAYNVYYPKVYVFYSSNEIDYSDCFNGRYVVSLDENMDGLVNVNDVLLEDYLKLINEERLINLIVAGILLAVGFIFTFFIMRSKMINRIYDIGVLRALGSSKKSIYAMFFKESFILTTSTSIVGYVIMLLLAYLYNVIFKVVGNNYVFSAPHILFGFFLIYLANSVLSLLPIIFLLRKTPSEILSKYDM